MGNNGIHEQAFLDALTGHAVNGYTRHYWCVLGDLYITYWNPAADDNGLPINHSIDIFNFKVFLCSRVLRVE